MAALSSPVAFSSAFETSGEDLDFILNALAHHNIRSLLPEAREEFYLRRGKPVPEDPFFDAYMTIFLEWFIIDRPFMNGVSPLRDFLTGRPTLEQSRNLSRHHLLMSHHSLFEVMTPWKKDFFWLRDLIYGDDWLVTHWPPFPGIDPGQPLECRLVFSHERVTLTPGIVVYPFSARDAIHELIAKLKDQMGLETIMDLIAKLTVRAFRYPKLSPKRFYSLEDPLTRDIAQQVGLSPVKSDGA